MENEGATTAIFVFHTLVERPVTRTRPIPEWVSAELMSRHVQSTESSERLTMFFSLSLSNEAEDTVMVTISTIRHAGRDASVRRRQLGVREGPAAATAVNPDPGHVGP